MEDSATLRDRLRRVGLSDSVIDAAWPTWWSDEADFSPSARAELRFSLSRKLGLDPHSLLQDGESPRFIWRDEARFKHLLEEREGELSAITSFGTALGGYVLAATAVPAYSGPLDSLNLREIVLHGQSFIRLIDLLSICWSVGVPVIHLRVFPLVRKRMAAMVIRADTRNAIMLGKDSNYPAHISFYLAHELAHIALGHLGPSAAIVDLEGPDLASADDPEESEADRFALELLTGGADPRVLPKGEDYSARELARVALESAAELRIEPGTLALCFGYSTGDWATANAAMAVIYAAAKPVWAEINKVAVSHLDLDLIPEDARSYVRAALGEPSAP